MKRIPITIIAGFLGSGKTTLINEILDKNSHLKENQLNIGIVLNEFGGVKLESKFIDSKNEGIVELSNGCVCCVARGDMIETLTKIVTQYANTNYIIIESSGLSDPIALSLTFYNPSVVEKFSLDSIVCVVDAQNFEEELDEYDIARKQISDANIIVISKVDKTKNSSQLKELVTSLNNKAIVYEENTEFNPLNLLDLSLINLNDTKDLAEIEEHEHSHEEFEHYLFISNKPLNFNRFEGFINNLNSKVIRAKGFINFHHAPHKDKKYLLQYVIGRKDYLIKDWENDSKTTALLFIGKNFDQRKLREELELIQN